MSDPYASADDVRNVLGTIGNRLPAWVDLDVFLSAGHAEVVDRLAGVYPDGIPAFAGDGLTVVRWAEAKLTAADVLDAIRVQVDDLGDGPDRLRASAVAALSDGVVGYPPGSSGVDVDGTTVPVSTSPRWSSYTPLSAFPDPYDAVRGGVDDPDYG